LNINLKTAQNSIVIFGDFEDLGNLEVLREKIKNKLKKLNLNELNFVFAKRVVKDGKAEATFKILN
jgi:hypothetical protein